MTDSSVSALGWGSVTGQYTGLAAWSWEALTVPVEVSPSESLRLASSSSLTLLLLLEIGFHCVALDVWKTQYTPDWT